MSAGSSAHQLSPASEKKGLEITEGRVSLQLALGSGLLTGGFLSEWCGQRVSDPS